MELEYFLFAQFSLNASAHWEGHQPQKREKLLKTEHLKYTTNCLDRGMDGWSVVLTL